MLKVMVPPYEIYESENGLDARAVLARNGITDREVNEVLRSDGRLPLPMVADYGARLVAIYGRTRAGRSLRVDVRMALGFQRIVVGAGDMTEAELAHYEKWVGDGDDY